MIQYYNIIVQILSIETKKMIQEIDTQKQFANRLESLQINPKVYYKNGGIFAKDKIFKNQVIFKIHKKDTICYSNIEQKFKQLFQYKKKTQVLQRAQKSNKTNYQEKMFIMSKNNLNMDQKEIILLLYLVYLNLEDKNQRKTQQKQYSQELKERFEEKLFDLWLKNSKSMGFVSFPSQLIHKTNDQNLIIQYHAYKNTVIQFSQKLVFFIQENVKEYENQHHKNNFCQSFKIIPDSQLKRLILQCLQLKNTRSFGYTQQTMIIPYFDFLNHSSSENVQLKLRDCSSQTQNYQYNQKQKQALNKANQNVQLLSLSYQNQDSVQLSSDSSQEDQFPQHIQIQTEKNDGKESNKNTKKCLEIITVRQIQQEEQLFLNYGSRSNEYLLKWYGFVEKNNPYDRIKIYYDLYKDKIYFDQIQRSTQEVTFRFHSSIKNYQLLQELKFLYHLKQEVQDKNIFNFQLKIDPNSNLIEQMQSIQNCFKKYRCGPKSSKAIMKLICLSKKYNQKRFYTTNSNNFNRKLIFSIPEDLQFQSFSIKDLIKRLTNRQNILFLQQRQKSNLKQSFYQKLLKDYHKQQLKVYIHHLKIIIEVMNFIQLLIKLKRINLTQMKTCQQSQAIPNENQLQLQKDEKYLQIKQKLTLEMSKTCLGLHELGDYMILMIKSIK